LGTEVPRKEVSGVRFQVSGNAPAKKQGMT